MGWDTSIDRREDPVLLPGLSAAPKGAEFEPNTVALKRYLDTNLAGCWSESEIVVTVEITRGAKASSLVHSNVALGAALPLARATPDECVRATLAVLAQQCRWLVHSWLL